MPAKLATTGSFLTWVSRWYVWIMLTLVGASGTALAWYHSPTTDEMIHTSSAYLALTRGEFRFDPEHPFLFKYLTALPLLPLDLNLPAEDTSLWAAAEPTFHDSWREARSWADQWLYASGNNAELMIVLARLPGLASLLALCWLTYILSRDWFNETVARWSLFFTATNPTLLAHGPLTNTDIPLALTFLATLGTLWYYYKKPIPQRAALIGLFLGIALTTKFSAISLLPITFLWILYIWLHRTKQLSNKLKIVALHTLIVALVTWIVIWLVYGLQSPLHLQGAPTSYPLVVAEEALAKVGIDLTSASRILRWILPSDWWKGFFLVTIGGMIGRSTFILGQFHSTGVWYYFPVLFLLKHQFVVILLGLTGLGLAIPQVLRVRRWQPITILLVLATAIVTILSVTSKLNLGIRHLSPLLPLFSIALALTLQQIQQFIPSRRTPILIVIFTVLPLILHAPNLIGFSNALVSPYSKAYWYFGDSNLDWGQQSRRIATVVHERYPNQAIYANYPWTPYALSYYGIENQWFEASNPPGDGVIIVTATQLGGESTYRAFRDRTPDFILDNTTFFYTPEK